MLILTCLRLARNDEPHVELQSIAKASQMHLSKAKNRAEIEQSVHRTINCGYTTHHACKVLYRRAIQWILPTTGLHRRFG